MVVECVFTHTRIVVKYRYCIEMFIHI